MKRVCIIVCYFGKLPNYFSLFLTSCKVNNEFDWLLFCDDDIEVYTIPDNVHVIKMSFTAIVDIIRNKLSQKYVCKKPYKLCDYKPAYGVLFDEYLKEYDYWGHCDLDMIFGKLYPFLLYPLKKGYDKILFHGHLTLYRNSPSVNMRFKLSFSGIEADYVFKFDTSFGFDEKRGINRIYKEYGFSWWQNEHIFLDTKIPYHSSEITFYNIANSKSQLPVISNGHLYLYTINDKNEIIRKEFAYIHLQKRKFTDIRNFEDSNCLIYPSDFIFKNTIQESDLQIYKYKYYYSDLIQKKHFISIKYKIHIIINILFFRKFALMKQR